MFWVSEYLGNLRYLHVLESLMSTNIVCFYGEISKIIPYHYIPFLLVPLNYIEPGHRKTYKMIMCPQ